MQSVANLTQVPAEAFWYIMSLLQLIILAVLGWNLSTTLRTQTRVIKLEAKVFDVLVAGQKELSIRVTRLEDDARSKK